MAMVCDGYTGFQVFRENFVSTQRAICGLVDELPEEGFTPRLIDTYWTKGAAVVVCQDEGTRDWLGSKVPTPTAVEGSRFKMVGLGTLPTYKKMVAWLPGPVEDKGRYLQGLRRLNQGLDIIWLQRPDYCPLIGHNPGLLLVFLLDITPWEDIYM